MKKEQLKIGKIEKKHKQELVDFMEKTGQKVTAIAKAIDCHPQTLYGWIKGEKSIGVNTLDAINNHIENYTENGKG